MNTDEVISYIKSLEEAVDDNPELLMSLEFREILKSDFRIFLHFCWKETMGLTPHRIQLEFADLMQIGEDRVLMAMREFGKSITNGAFVCWNLLRDPNFTVLIVSATKPRASRVCSTALSIIKGCPFLTHMEPDLKRGDYDGKEAFTVGSRNLVINDPSCVATSITSGNTGAHADLILSDDIEIPKNSDTQQKRLDILKGVEEYAWIGNDGGTELFIGTPQTEDSVYFKLREEGNHTLYRVPCRYPDVLDEKQMRHLAPFMLDELRRDNDLSGDLTYPERFTVEYLDKMRAKSASEFSLQMMLDPSLSDEDRYPLKLRNFIVMDLSAHEAPQRIVWGNVNPIPNIPSVGKGKDMFYGPNFVDLQSSKPYDHIIMGIDPAGSGADEVGYCIAGGIHGNVYVLAAGGIDGGHDDGTLRKLCRFMIEYNVKEVRVEKNFGNGMYGKHLARVMGEMYVKAGLSPDVVAKGQKEVRILETLEPAMANHKVIIDTKVAKDQVLMKQITSLTSERGSLIHDDRVDAMEICLSGFTDSMILNTDKLVEENKAQDFQNEISSYMNNSNMNTYRNTNSRGSSSFFSSKSKNNGKSMW